MRGGCVVELFNGREHGGRTVLTSSYFNTSEAQSLRLWLNFWRAKPSTKTQLAGCPAVTSHGRTRRGSEVPVSRGAGSDVPPRRHLPSWARPAFHPRAANRGQGEAAARSPMSDKVRPFESLFKTERLPSDHRGKHSSGLHYWGQVCAQRGCH